MNDVHGDVPSWVKRTVPALIVLMMGLLLLLPAGENLRSDYGGYWDEARNEWVEVHHERPLGTTTGRILGQLSFQMLLLSLLLAYRAPTRWFIQDRIRLRIHRVLGLLILTLGLAHAAVLLPNEVFRGWLTGTLSFCILVLHGVTGSWKPAFLRAWGPKRWRYVHLATAYAGLLIGLQHALFYGQHYGLLRAGKH